jgi:hypothetical protein
MQAYKVMAEINPDRQLTLTLPSAMPIGRAEVIVLSHSHQYPRKDADGTHPKGMRQYLQWLDTQPERPRMSSEEIERWIAELRDDWD